MTDTRAVRTRTRGARVRRPATVAGRRRSAPTCLVSPVEADRRLSELDVATDLLASARTSCWSRTSIPTPTRWAARWRWGWVWPGAASRSRCRSPSRDAFPNRCAACPAASGGRARRPAADIPTCWSAWTSARWSGSDRWPGCWTPAGRAWSSTTTPSNTRFGQFHCRRRRRGHGRAGRAAAGPARHPHRPGDRARTSTPAWPPTPATSGTPTPDAHLLAARLIDAGVRPPDVMLPITDSHPFGWLGMLSDVLGAAGAGCRRPRSGRGLVYTVIDDESGPGCARRSSTR